MVLRWFPGGIRVRQLAAGNHIDTTTCYDRLHQATGLLAALAVCESEYQMPTLTDLGYLNVSPTIRHPFK